MRIIKLCLFAILTNSHIKVYSSFSLWVPGSTAQEIDLLPTPGAQLKSWDREEMEDHIAHKLDTFGGSTTSDALALYPWQHDAEYTFTTMTSDLRVTCPNNQLALRAAAGLESAVYRLVVTSWPSSPVPLWVDWSPKYAFHGWDTLAIFDLFQVALASEPTEADEGFRRQMQELVVEFVESGQPSTSTSWLPFPQTTALISHSINYVTQYHQEQCDFWINQGFLPYDWIN